MANHPIRKPSKLQAYHDPFSTLLYSGSDGKKKMTIFDERKRIYKNPGAFPKLIKPVPVDKLNDLFFEDHEDLKTKEIIEKIVAKRKEKNLEEDHEESGL